MASSGNLHRQQRADAIREVKAILAEVRTDWTYTPPTPRRPPQPLTRNVSTRSGVLGAWRPTAESFADEPEPEDSWDEAWASTDESSDDDDELSDTPRDTLQRSRSYRRPKTPPNQLPKRKRRRKINRDNGEWRRRVEDSDFEIPDGDPLEVGEFEGYEVVKEKPTMKDWTEAPPSPRRKRRRYERALIKSNPGLRTWWRRRDQWTGADVEGYVPVGRSKFEGSVLSQMVEPGHYMEIYQKCVVRGNELPVPINLKNMIDALVMGWKSDDLWPPKPTEPQGSMGGRVKRYLGIR
ncbi:hypothetical protein BZA77DRAFT_307838 [Pyronema omphalodes]|nr:hypothetical protein BZA77DRAFT_307838 [Pyronema omphalodes]